MLTLRPLARVKCADSCEVTDTVGWWNKKLEKVCGLVQRDDLSWKMRIHGHFTDMWQSHLVLSDIDVFSQFVTPVIVTQKGRRVWWGSLEIHWSNSRHHRTSLLHESRLEQWGCSLWFWFYVIQSLVCQDPKDERRSWPGLAVKVKLGVAVSSCNIVLLASYSLHLFDRFAWARVHQCRHFSGNRDPARIVWRKMVLGSAGCINCSALCSGQTFL